MMVSSTNKQIFNTIFAAGVTVEKLLLLPELSVMLKAQTISPRIRQNFNYL